MFHKITSGSKNIKNIQNISQFHFNDIMKQTLLNKSRQFHLSNNALKCNSQVYNLSEISFQSVTHVQIAVLREILPLCKTCNQSETK